MNAFYDHRLSIIEANSEVEWHAVLFQNVIKAWIDNKKNMYESDYNKYKYYVS